MINIFLIGPFLGPALAGYIGAGSNWKASFGVLTAFYALSTILIFLFGYETYYAVGRTLAHWTKILAIYIFKFPLLLTGIATMVNFCWPIGITVTVSTFVAQPPYLFDTVQSASLRWAPIIGGLLGKQHPRIPDRGPDSVRLCIWLLV